MANPLELDRPVSIHTAVFSAPKAVIGYWQDLSTPSRGGNQQRVRTSTRSSEFNIVSTSALGFKESALRIYFRSGVDYGIGHHG